MKRERLGDRGWILREISGDPAAYAEALRRAEIPGLLDAVASYDTVGVYFEPPFEIDRVAIPVPQSPKGLRHEIPVCYEMGEDLLECTERLGIAVEEFTSAHTAVDYRCFGVGFCPGFPYLGYLPDLLSGLPRRETPRLRVPPGSVAIAGNQTGIYPLERPGGWWLVGRTPLELVNVEEDYFPILAGDIVRFRAISTKEFGARQGERLPQR